MKHALLVNEMHKIVSRKNGVRYNKILKFYRPVSIAKCILLNSENKMLPTASGNSFNL